MIDFLIVAMCMSMILLISQEALFISTINLIIGNILQRRNHWVIVHPSQLNKLSKETVMNTVI